MATLTKDRVGPFGTNDYCVSSGGRLLGWLYRWYTGKVAGFPGKVYLWSFASAEDSGLHAKSWGSFKDAKADIERWA